MAREDLMALKMLGQPAEEEMGMGLPEMGGDLEPEMPLQTSKGSGDVFVPRDLFQGEKLKRGQRVCLYGTVTATGNKIGIQPDKGSLDSETPEDEMDEDLDDAMEDDADIKD